MNKRLRFGPPKRDIWPTGWDFSFLKFKALCRLVGVLRDRISSKLSCSRFGGAYHSSSENLKTLAFTGRVLTVFATLCAFAWLYGKTESILLDTLGAPHNS